MFLVSNVTTPTFMVLIYFYSVFYVENMNTHNADNFCVSDHLRVFA
jgi:hypothetical protein